jgi:hypothetical protein
MVCSHLKRAYILINTLTILIGTYHWYQSQVDIMSTNKEHIEILEAGLSGLCIEWSWEWQTNLVNGGHTQLYV